MGLWLIVLISISNKYLSGPQVAVAKDFATDIIQFVCGKPPWTPFNSSDVSPREYSEYSPRGATKPVDASSTPAEKYMGRFGLDVLLDAIQAFIAGL